MNNHQTTDRYKSIRFKLQFANYQLGNEIKEYPYHEEEPFILINEQDRFYHPYTIDNDKIQFGDSTILIKHIFDVKFFPGHGV